MPAPWKFTKLLWGSISFQKEKWHWSYHSFCIQVTSTFLSQCFHNHYNTKGEVRRTFFGSCFSLVLRSSVLHPCFCFVHVDDSIYNHTGFWELGYINYPNNFIHWNIKGENKIYSFFFLSSIIDYYDNRGNNSQISALYGQKETFIYD